MGFPKQIILQHVEMYLALKDKEKGKPHNCKPELLPMNL